MENELRKEDVAVAVWNDGISSCHQAKCLECSWNGPWRRNEANAVKDAKSHTHHIDLDAYDWAPQPYHDPTDLGGLMSIKRDRDRLESHAAAVGNRSIIKTDGFTVARLGDGWYQMQCLICPAPSVRSRDWQELTEWGHIHQQRHHG